MSVLVVLGLVWAAVLVPPLLRARSERRTEFIESFQEQMGALGSKVRAGRTSAVQERSHGRRRRPVSAKKRRRDILGGLLGAMIGSLVLGLIPSLRIVLFLHLFLLNLFIGYVALLAHHSRRPAPVRAWKPAAARGTVRVRRERGTVPKPALAPVLHTPLSTRR